MLNVQIFQVLTFLIGRSHCASTNFQPEELAPLPAWLPVQVWSNGAVHGEYQLRAREILHGLEWTRHTVSCVIPCSGKLRYHIFVIQVG